jgi:nicotinamidase-related amidase
VKRILWDVDTQADFVHTDGKLAVPDAEGAVPAMAILVEAARSAGVPHDPDEVILFGVATDVCNHAAILGLLARGRSVTFVEEASRGLDEARTLACTTEWRDRGVRFASVPEVAAGL